MSDDKNNSDYYVLEDNVIDDMIFDQENVDHFLLYQKTVELVGIVGETAMKSNLLKFNLTNKSGMTIQVLIWDADIVERMKKFIVSGNVIHIDGASVREKHPTMSNSTVAFDLTLNSNAKVRLIKSVPQYTCTDISDKNVRLTTIEDSLNHAGTMQIIAYVKQKIAETFLPNGKINAGCICDCKKFKLEVRMPQICDMSDFPVGSHVRLIGTIKFGVHPYLWVLRKENVQIESADIKKISDLLKANTIPKRALDDVSNKVPFKKIKQ